MKQKRDTAFVWSGDAELKIRDELRALAYTTDIIPTLIARIAQEPYGESCPHWLAPNVRLKTFPSNVGHRPLQHSDIWSNTRRKADDIAGVIYVIDPANETLQLLAIEVEDDIDRLARVFQEARNWPGLNVLEQIVRLVAG